MYWLNQLIAQKHPFMFIPKVLSQYWSHQVSCIDCLLMAWLYQGQSILTQRQPATYCTEHYCTWQHCTVLGALHYITLPNYIPLRCAVLVQLLDSKYSRTAQIHQSSEILNSLNKDLITRACACTWVTRSAILSVFVAFCQWLWWWWWWWLWWLYYITVHWTVTMMGRWPHQRQVGRIGGRSDIALQLDVTMREWALNRSICICNIICICEYICISICMQQWLDVTMKGWALSRSICICIFSICILCVFVSVFVCSSDVTLQLNDTLRG